MSAQARRSGETALSFAAAPEEIIDEARNGRMFILVDDEDRENEGDLVIPAQMATPDAINFMARFGRGLVCLCLTQERVRQLKLPPMAAANGARHQTAFTVSIEAREGVSTGISAADRALTIAAAVDANNGPSALVSPGHVFPLAARDGGVLVRAGHTEAAVDVSRLAGLNPSGVICEIMNEDGTMARRDDLIAFAQRHGMKIGTIRDLIAYRRRHDHSVERTEEGELLSDYGGRWRVLTYRNKVDGSLSKVLQMGEIDPAQPTLVRVHAMSVMDDMLGRSGPRKRLPQRSMMRIGQAGAGVLVIMYAEDADETDMDPRMYGIGAQILADVGVHDMIVLSNSQQMLVGLEAYGLHVVGVRAIPADPAR